MSDHGDEWVPTYEKATPLCIACPHEARAERAEGQAERAAGDVVGLRAETTRLRNALAEASQASHHHVREMSGDNVHKGDWATCPHPACVKDRALAACPSATDSGVRLTEEQAAKAYETVSWARREVGASDIEAGTLGDLLHDLSLLLGLLRPPATEGKP